MGDIDELLVPLRLVTERDRRVAENLRCAIEELIASDVEYRRIAVNGVC